MRNFSKLLPAFLLLTLFSCAKAEYEVEVPQMPQEVQMPEGPGVFGYLDPIVFDGSVDTKATANPDNLKYIWEVGDKINIWDEAGTTLVIHEVKSTSSDGYTADFDGGSFTLTEGETYYSSHPLIADTDESIEALSTSYVGQTQTANNDARHIASKTYTYASAVCTNGNTSFRYHHLSAFIKFNVTLPEALTLTELSLTADSPVFALDGTSNIKTGVFTSGTMSKVMTLTLDNIQVADVLKASLAVAPYSAASFTVRVKDNEGNVYVSPAVSKNALAAGHGTQFNVTVSYEDPNVAQIGDVKYLTLAAAIAAVPTDGTQTTITMIGDDNVDVVSYAMTVASGQNVIIELNGHTVAGVSTTGATSALIRNLGTLKIMDSSGTGKMTMDADPYWVYSEADPGGYASNLIRNEGNLTVEGGLLYNYGVGSACYAIDNYGSGKVTINGGTVDVKKASAIRLFYNNGGIITVNDGTIGHYNSDDDCTYMGIQVMAGTNAVVNVTGGTIVGMYALYSSATGTSSVNITNGLFDGYVGFDSAGPDNISISGGTFYYWTGTWGSQTGFITGGTFYEEPDAEYIADGYHAEENDDNWIVIPDAPTVASINGVKYETLEAAIAAVPTDGTQTTITMIADAAVVEGVTVQASQNILIELNGKTISGNTDASSTYALITNKGTLTIQDNTDTNIDGTGSGLITTYISNPDGGDVPGYASNTITNHGSLTVKSGKIVNNGSGYACYAIDNQTNGNLYTPTLTIDGGRMQQMNAYTYAVRMFCNSTSNVNSVTVNGGVIEGGYGLWLQTPNEKANKASLTITGGTLNARDGAALYIGGTKAVNSEISIDISGGEINGTGAIIQGPLSGYYGSVAISGGTFENIQCGANIEQFITGGQFKLNPSAVYLADGYSAVQGTDGYYIVGAN